MKEINMEVWKDIEGYEKLYQISNLGRIKSLPKGKHSRKTEMLLKLKGNEYKCVNLCKDGIVQTHTVHRLVAKHFIPNPLNKPIVNHIDCNPSNNIFSNLEWVTSLENQMHSRKLGRYKNCDKKSSQRFRVMHENKDIRLKNYNE